jgi:hypothetical protein
MMYYSVRSDRANHEAATISKLCHRLLKMFSGAKVSTLDPTTSLGQRTRIDDRADIEIAI